MNETATDTFNAILVHADAALEDGSTSDDLAATLAYELDVDADTIAEDVAELLERLTIAADLADDTEHAFWIHYGKTYHGGDVTALRERELDAARQAAERIAARMNDPERDHDADLAALRDSDYGRYLDRLDRDAERGLAQFYADMARLAAKEES